MEYKGSTRAERLRLMFFVLKSMIGTVIMTVSVSNSTSAVVDESVYIEKMIPTANGRRENQTKQQQAQQLRNWDVTADWHAMAIIRDALVHRHISVASVFLWHLGRFPQFSLINDHYLDIWYSIIAYHAVAFFQLARLQMWWRMEE